MTKARWAFLVSALVFSGAFEGQAFAQSTVFDPFNYPVYSPVPSPWAWIVSGSSSNELVYGSGNNGTILQLNYSGSGWYNLTRSDIAGSNAEYAIQFWDDGTRNYGELFYVENSAGDFIGIGVNNNVANGYYYARTGASGGNTGPTIYAPRNGQAVNNNWHLFQLFVTPMGSYPAVDGVSIPGYLYQNVNSVVDVTLMGNWSKPAQSAWVDNFQTIPLYPTDIPNGTQFTAAGTVYVPGGSSTWVQPAIDDYRTFFARGAGAAWASANPVRYNVVMDAVREADIGLCGDAARSKYNASGEWCSEFGRWVLENTPGVHNYCTKEDMGPLLIPGVAPQELYEYYSLGGVTVTSELCFVYSSWYGGYTTRAQITRWTPHPGDFVSLHGSSGDNGHTGIVVGVADDARYIWTVEGNVTAGPGTLDCVRPNRHDFFVNGVLGPDIDGFGNTDVLIQSPAPAYSPWFSSCF